GDLRQVNRWGEHAAADGLPGSSHAEWSLSDARRTQYRAPNARGARAQPAGALALWGNATAQCLPIAHPGIGT
ncbi:MAG: hypothetical protein LC808_10805, partial [Actinobacteria bacterium]|nr:hypothetical protein [Actinomycetota bacterium]